MEVSMAAAVTLRNAVTLWWNMVFLASFRSSPSSHQRSVFYRSDALPAAQPQCQRTECVNEKWHRNAEIPTRPQTWAWVLAGTRACSRTGRRRRWPGRDSTGEDVSDTAVRPDWRTPHTSQPLNAVLTYLYDSTSIRRPFDCLSKVIRLKVTAT